MTEKELRELEREGKWLLKRSYYKSVCKSKFKHKTFEDAKKAELSSTAKYKKKMYAYACPYSVGHKNMKTHWHLATVKRTDVTPVDK